MRIRIGNTGVLTTEHAASSYGLPVLVVDEQAYGPADVLPSGEPAADVVMRWGMHPSRSIHDRGAAVVFFLQGDLLVDRQQIADMAGVKPYTVNQWSHRGIIPDPVLRLPGRDLYLRSQVERALRDSGRLKP